MVDEFHERYRQQTHEELYRLLMAGLPAQVDAIADTWHGVEEALGSLATALRDDLARVLPTWTGPGSREFHYRLGLIVTFAQKLAEEAVAMRTGLTVMSGSLAETQRQVEPDRPELSQSRYDGISAMLGHTLSEEERAKARERVSALVARLAAEYAVADHRTWPAVIPIEPRDLPIVGTIVDDLDLPSRVPIDDPASALVEPTSGTGLAGAGAFGAAPGVGGVPALSPTSSPHQPASVLSGAGPALAGMGGHLITRGSGSGAEARPGAATGATAAGAGAGGVPPAAMGGAGMAGRPADGYAITDPRLAEASTGWSGDGTLEWTGETDAPPPILGEPGNA